MTRYIRERAFSSDDPLLDNWLAFLLVIIGDKDGREISIEKALKAMGGYSRKYTKSAEIQAFDNKVLKMYLHGIGAPEMAKQIGCKRSRIYSALHRHGIYLKKPKYGMNA